MLQSFAARRRERAQEEPQLLGFRQALSRRGARSSTSPTPTACQRPQLGQVDAIVDVPFAQVATVDVERQPQGARIRGRQLADDHHGDRPGAVQRVRGAPGDAADRRPRGDGRPCCRVTAAWPTTCTACSTRATQRLPAARAGHRAGQAAARGGRPGGPDDRPVRPTTRPACPSCRGLRRAGRGGRCHGQRKVLDGGTYWGDEYTKRTFATSFWGTRPYLNQVAAGSLPTATYPETHWPPEGSNFIEALPRRRWPRPTRKPAARSSARCSSRSTTRAATSSRSSTTSSTPTARHVKGLVARTNVLNLDHFGRGFKNIWLELTESTGEGRHVTTNPRRGSPRAS